MAQHKNTDRTDTFFKSTLSGAKLKPGENVWAGIEADLLRKKEKKNRRRILYLYWSLAASLLLLISTGGYLFFTNNTELAKKSSSESDTRSVVSDTSPEKTKQSINGSSSDSASAHQHSTIRANDLSNNASEAKQRKQLRTNFENMPAQDSKAYTASSTFRKENAFAKLNSKRANSNEEAEITTAKSDTELMNKQTEKKSSATGAETMAAAINSSTSVRDNDSASIDSDTPVAQIGPARIFLNSDSALNNLLAQVDNTLPEKDEKRKWWVGGMYSMDYSNQKFINRGDETVAKQLGAFYSNTSSYKKSFSSGIQAGLSLNKRWGIQMGVIYADKGESASGALTFKSSNNSGTNQPLTANVNSGDSIANPIWLWSSSSSSSSSGTSQASQPNAIGLDDTWDMEYKYQYIDIPLLINYHYELRKMNVYVTSGFSTNIFLKSQVIAKRENGQEYYRAEERTMRAVNFSVIISCGIEYPLGQHLRLNLEPNFRHSITSISKYGQTRAFPYSIGLGSGIRYYF